MISRVVPCPTDYALGESLRPLQFGRDDPTMRCTADEVWWAMRTSGGPATLHFLHLGDTLQIDVWGDGAGVAAEGAPAFAGLCDDVSAFSPPAQSPLDLIVSRHGGFRLGQSGDPTEALIRAITGLAPSAFEAHRAHRQLVTALGDDAPGPGGLRLGPTSDQIAGTAAYDLHTIGFPPTIADLLRRSAAQSHRLHDVDGLEDLRKAIQALSGLPAGTADRVLLDAGGDPDAVPVGEPQRAHDVGRVLAEEPNADDDRMLELLEPWRGQRGRVIRLIETDVSPSLPPRSV